MLENQGIIPQDTGFKVDDINTPNNDFLQLQKDLLKLTCPDGTFETAKNPSGGVTKATDTGTGNEVETVHDALNEILKVITGNGIVVLPTPISDEEARLEKDRIEFENLTNEFIRALDSVGGTTKATDFSTGNEVETVHDALNEILKVITGNGIVVLPTPTSDEEARLEKDRIEFENLTNEFIRAIDSVGGRTKATDLGTGNEVQTIHDALNELIKVIAGNGIVVLPTPTSDEEARLEKDRIEFINSTKEAIRALDSIGSSTKAKDLATGKEVETMHKPESEQIEHIANKGVIIKSTTVPGATTKLGANANGAQIELKHTSGDSAIIRVGTDGRVEIPGKLEVCDDIILKGDLVDSLGNSLLGGGSTGIQNGDNASLDSINSTYIKNSGDVEICGDLKLKGNFIDSTGNTISFLDNIGFQITNTTMPDNTALVAPSIIRTSNTTTGASAVISSFGSGAQVRLTHSSGNSGNITVGTDGEILIPGDAEICGDLKLKGNLIDSTGNTVSSLDNIGFQVTNTTMPDNSALFAPSIIRTSNTSTGASVVISSFGSGSQVRLTHSSGNSGNITVGSNGEIKIPGNAEVCGDLKLKGDLVDSLGNSLLGGGTANLDTINSNQITNAGTFTNAGNAEICGDLKLKGSLLDSTGNSVIDLTSSGIGISDNSAPNVFVLHSASNSTYINSSGAGSNVLVGNNGGTAMVGLTQGANSGLITVGSNGGINVDKLEVTGNAEICGNLKLKGSFIDSTGNTITFLDNLGFKVTNTSNPDNSSVVTSTVVGTGNDNTGASVSMGSAGSAPEILFVHASGNSGSITVGSNGEIKIPGNAEICGDLKLKGSITDSTGNTVADVTSSGIVVSDNTVPNNFVTHSGSTTTYINTGGTGSNVLIGNNGGTAMIGMSQGANSGLITVGSNGGINLDKLEVTGNAEICGDLILKGGLTDTAGNSLIPSVPSLDTINTNEITVAGNAEVCGNLTTKGKILDASGNFEMTNTGTGVVFNNNSNPVPATVVNETGIGVTTTPGGGGAFFGVDFLNSGYIFLTNSNGNTGEIKVGTNGEILIPGSAEICGGLKVKGGITDSAGASMSTFGSIGITTQSTATNDNSFVTVGLDPLDGGSIIIMGDSAGNQGTLKTKAGGGLATPGDFEVCGDLTVKGKILDATGTQMMERQNTGFTFDDVTTPGVNFLEVQKDILRFNDANGTFETTKETSGGTIKATDTGTGNEVITVYDALDQRIRETSEKEEHSNNGDMSKVRTIDDGNKVIVEEHNDAGAGVSIKLTYDPNNNVVTREGVQTEVTQDGTNMDRVELFDGINRTFGTQVTDGATTNSTGFVFDPNNNQNINFGNFHVQGNLSKLGGTFKIDHPLDPYNKYLVHSFVESPDMMNIYNGNITTDKDGFATVEMPDYFETLNMDFRYQLTVIGDFAQAIVAEEIADNTFKVRTDKPNVKVSWQITGVRQDTYANENRIQAEVEKEEGMKGKLLYESKEIRSSK